MENNEEKINKANERLTPEVVSKVDEMLDEILDENSTIKEDNNIDESKEAKSILKLFKCTENFKYAAFGILVGGFIVYTTMRNKALERELVYKEELSQYKIINSRMSQKILEYENYCNYINAKGDIKIGASLISEGLISKICNVSDILCNNVIDLISYTKENAVASTHQLVEDFGRLMNMIRNK